MSGYILKNMTPECDDCRWIDGCVCECLCEDVENNNSLEVMIQEEYYDDLYVRYEEYFNIIKDYDDGKSDY